jgi:hypothetical protein
MRTPLAIVILVGSTVALAATASADRTNQRNAKAPQYSDTPRGQYYASPRAVCEERARAEDPTGLYAGFPCWAREAFGRGSQGGRVHR